ncbi:benzoate carboxyl methyltransferase-like [Andrographis paniculata]|uniref:benzoate carboxyl methyltransferase-like n=1 Tax=Andrographis paniculata TaxID=175694 RepID=UPI0021E84677|nr:benzoate carboxyl methyltransferase-like [Andrographis paniculata]XP_051147511.1 benzoate carboxyl methyltransferase-like [Andrographis paniculata]
MEDFVVHMNGGDDALSYANNSSFQRVVISKTWPVLDKTLKDMFDKTGFKSGFKMIDLGCASGPNTLVVISHIMDTIKTLCKCDQLPEFEVYLNDLPANDFNNLFKMLPSFHQGWKNCFVFGLPGSFYERLLPSNSLHFAYSNYCLQWLSQIPEGVEKSNKENFIPIKTSPVEVFEAYEQQFRRDFSTFLSKRGEEMIIGGYTVLAFVGRNSVDFSSDDSYESLRLLAEALVDMVAEGLINEEDLHSFNIPIYFPCREEVEAIIEQEGSFNIKELEAFKVPWDTNTYEDDDYGKTVDNYRSREIIASHVRAAFEPLLSNHFSNAKIDMNILFERYAQKLRDYIVEEMPSYFTLLISLNRI